MSTDARTQRDDVNLPVYEMPHDCVLPESERPADDLRGKMVRPERLVGLDVARAVALIGMVAVHTMSAETDDGSLSVSWLLASGKASALFAVLAGIGLAFMSGRTVPPRGDRWVRAIMRQVIRAVAMFVIGLLLADVSPWDDVAIILPYLALMFAIGSLFAPLGARALIALGLVWALVSPVLSFLLRSDVPQAAGHNVTFGSFLSAPVSELGYLLLFGTFPALTWMTYILVGMGVGRLRLGFRRTAAVLLGLGAVITVIARTATWILVQFVGVRSLIAEDVQGLMPLDTYADYLVFGGDGSVPTNSWWWLGINASHTGTPLDLLETTGIALLVIGACLGLAHVTGSAMSLLAVPGSMTLTLYSLHVVLVQLLGDLSEVLHFGLQLVLLTTFAMVWHKWFARGPLEELLNLLTRAILRRPKNASTPSGSSAAAASDASPGSARGGTEAQYTSESHG